MKALKTIILLALAVTATSALAIDQEAGIHFIVGDPRGEFSETVENPGFGIAGHYGLRVLPALTLGVGLDGMIYGSETYREELPRVEPFNINTSNNLFNGFLFAQVRPFEGPVQPYAEARIGFRYLWTESKIEDADWWDDDDVASTTNYDDSTTYWGGGGGLLIRLNEGDYLSGSPGVFLDFKVTYQKGDEAKYLTEGDISLDSNDEPVFDAKESKTDLTVFQLGVVLTF